MDKEGEWLACLRQKFSKICDAKNKERIFFGSPITQLFEDTDFSAG
jgi:hypothetical protein